LRGGGGGGGKTGTRSSEGVFLAREGDGEMREREERVLGPGRQAARAGSAARSGQGKPLDWRRRRPRETGQRDAGASRVTGGIT